jgi:Toastrack DUF4097
MNRHGITSSTSQVIRPSTARALLTLALVFAATAAAAAERVFDRSFTVAAGGLLTVNADGANISVLGGDSSQVVVHMVARASQKELDQMKWSASQSESGVNVEMLRSERGSWFNWGSWNLDAHIEVTVPRSYRVETKTSGGSVRLESVAGPSRLRTSGGGIVAKDVKGGLEAQTSGGGIHLESVEGLIQAHTSGGSINAANVRGDIDASTSGGTVRLLGVDGKIRASSSGGGVQCELIGANRGVSASTSGGSIRLILPKDITGALDAESSGGGVHSDFPVTSTRWGEHRLNGTINGGGETIYVRTSGGGITLSAAR